MFGPVGKSELQKVYQESLRREPAQELLKDSVSIATQGDALAREAVVALIVRYAENDSHELQFLLTLRADSLKEHASQVSFPGGMIEASERGDHRLALDREVFEEVGIRQGSIEWQTGHWDILPSLYGIRVFPYLGFISQKNSPESLVLQPGEVAAAAWLDFWQLFEPEAWARRELARAPWEWRGWEHVTWGLTAAFMALFVKRMSGRLPI